MKCTKVFILLIACSFLLFAACKKSVTSQQPAASPSPSASAGTVPEAQDACVLLTKEEIQAVQGEAVTDTKSNNRAGGLFTESQCYYLTTTPAKSVILTVYRASPNAQSQPKDFWEQRFAEADKEDERDRDKNREREKDKDRDKEREREKEKKGERGRGEEEEEGAPPQRVKGLGDEAFWTGNRITGALYVLKGNSFFRISIGGADDEETKIKKTTALARNILGRF